MSIMRDVTVGLMTGGDVGNMYLQRAAFRSVDLAAKKLESNLPPPVKKVVETGRQVIGSVASWTNELKNAALLSRGAQQIRTAI